MVYVTPSEKYAQLGLLSPTEWKKRTLLDGWETPSSSLAPPLNMEHLLGIWIPLAPNRSLLTTGQNMFQTTNRIYNKRAIEEWSLYGNYVLRFGGWFLALNGAVLPTISHFGGYGGFPSHHCCFNIRMVKQLVDLGTPV